MYKPSTYLLVTYFPTELVTKVKPNINSVEVHPQLNNNGHPVDNTLVCAGSLWPSHAGNGLEKCQGVIPEPVALLQ
jgi:hypothetical protein